MSRQEQMQLKKSAAPYAHSDHKASIIQLCNSILPLLALWALAYAAYSISPFITVALAIIAGGFVVRTFIIFHDCTHGSFFKSSKANDRIGTLTGIITHFSYAKWKRSHMMHHSTSGNLDKRGTGDVWVMTVEEYQNASKWLRLSYRLYRNPFVLFFLGPFYLFLVENRFNRKGAKRKERLNTYFTNISIVVIYALLIWLVGWAAFFTIQIPMLFTAGFLGIWLFYVQHTFEDSYFENEDKWDFVKAAVDGSSYYELPKVLQWITGNIGYHHVHHLSPRVPNYNLAKTHENIEPLQQATKITLGTSLTSIKFRLYDETNKTFVSFKEANIRSKRQAKDSLASPAPSDKKS